LRTTAERSCDNSLRVFYVPNVNCSPGSPTKRVTSQWVCDKITRRPDARCGGGELRRKRRIEVRVEREEISVFSEGLSGFSVEGKSDFSGEDWLSAARAYGNRPRPAAAENCPVCGSTDLLLLQSAVAAGAFSATGLQRGVESGGYHLHCSAAGEGWVCGGAPRGR